MGRYPRLLNFPRALSPKQSGVCMRGGGIICASLPLFHLLRLQHRMEETPPFSPPPPKLQILFLRITNTDRTHCLVFPAVCISKLEIQCGKRDCAGKPSEAGSALRIAMNASHVPRSLHSTEQLHSSLFQNSHPAAPFPGAVALLDGNRRCRLPASAITFAENRLKRLQTTPAPAVCSRGHSSDKLHL